MRHKLTVAIFLLIFKPAYGTENINKEELRSIITYYSEKYPFSQSTIDCCAEVIDTLPEEKYTTFHYLFTALSDEEMFKEEDETLFLIFSATESVVSKANQADIELFINMVNTMMYEDINFLQKAFVIDALGGLNPNIYQTMTIFGSENPYFFRDTNPYNFAYAGTPIVEGEEHIVEGEEHRPVLPEIPNSMSDWTEEHLSRVLSFFQGIQP